VVTNTAGIKESVKGKWWRPEDLGIVDYSQQSLVTSAGVMDSLMSAGGIAGHGVGGSGGGGGSGAVGGSGSGAGGAGKGHTRQESSGGGQKSLYNDNDDLEFTDGIVPLVPGLLDGFKDGGAYWSYVQLNYLFPQLFLSYKNYLFVLFILIIFGISYAWFWFFTT
jgi:hypothetical protein